jgi:hypothetical protein
MSTLDRLEQLVAELDTAIGYAEDPVLLEIAGYDWVARYDLILSILRRRRGALRARIRRANRAAS